MKHMIQLIQGGSVLFASEYRWSNENDLTKEINEITESSAGTVCWRSKEGVLTVINTTIIKSCLIEIFSDRIEDRDLMEKVNKERKPKEPETN